MTPRARAPSHAWPAVRFAAPLSAALERLSPRERKAVLSAAWVVGLGLLWWLAIAPALSTLRSAPERHARLDAQLDHMQAMAAAASALRADGQTQPLEREAALRAIGQATSALGATAELAVQGDSATLSLRGTAPAALARWLAEVRINAHVRPREARLTRDPVTGGWNGVLVLGGPGLATER